MKAVILAGGKGERLRPLTHKTPKPLLTIKNRTILEYVIDYLKSYGIRDLIITIGYRGEQIKKFFGNGKKFGVRIEYSVEKKPLGTAGCLVPLKNKLRETFILIGGDNLTKLNLKKFIEFHKRKKGILTVALFEFEEKSNWGIYNLNKDKSILNFMEKPVFKHTAGTMIFCLEPGIFKHIPKKPKGAVNLTDHTIPELLKKGIKIFGFKFSDFWEDIGNHDDYKRVKSMKDTLC
ncbi:MAG: nucleotidyltransferase family protein [Candidatus Aenigmarchaeota archaeon]